MKTIAEDCVDAIPKQINVLILEDHFPEAECICKELEDTPAKCEFASTLSDFYALAEKSLYEVTSLDWNIGEFAEGLDALKFARKQLPGAARLVFTVVGDSEGVARRNGADLFLKKERGYGQYLAAFQAASRLGFAREIAQLAKHPSIDLALLVHPLSREMEVSLCLHARDVAIQQVLEGRPSADLVDVLRRRGWWREFDSQGYSNLATSGKAAALVSYIKEPPNLFGEWVLDADDPGNSNRTNGLLSVLAYVLRLADYEPELFDYYWQVKALFKGSATPPPWDDIGLHEYIAINGVRGINQALLWIRSH